VEWAAYFEGLKAVKDVEERSPMTRLSTRGSSGSWEKVELPLLHNFVMANRSLKTPKQFRLGELQLVEVETLPMARECLEHFSQLEG
jgi:hypothetical protein